MTDQLSRADILQELEQQHGFTEFDIFLLPLVPLVEMVVADGLVQKAEIDILKDYTLRLLDTLREQAAGTEVVRREQASEFLNRLFNPQPNMELLKRLRQLCLRLIQLNSDPQWVAKQERTLLEYCLDIAAASVIGYPYPIRGRVIEQEKLLLAELVRHLKYTDRNAFSG